MDKYIVTLYEKCQKKYTILTSPVSYIVAKDFWIKKTNNGQKNSKKEHGDYYKIVKVNDGFIVSDYKV